MIEFPNQPDFPEQHTAIARRYHQHEPAGDKGIDRECHRKASILTIARVAAIQSIKQTANLIPLHLPGRIIGVQVDFDINVELACLKGHADRPSEQQRQQCHRSPDRPQFGAFERLRHDERR